MIYANFKFIKIDFACELFFGNFLLIFFSLSLFSRTLIGPNLVAWTHYKSANDQNKKFELLL